MKKKELQVIMSICLILSLRVFGMFMVFPVISFYSLILSNGNKFLMGCAIGIYGFTQCLLQIPFGFFSDKIGRKPVILFGLILFLLGNIIAGCMNSIWGLIFGRGLQGLGAISSSCMACLSDVVKDNKYTQIMFLVGVIYGISFSLSIIIAPIIINIMNFQGLFLVAACLSIFTILVTYFFIPNTHVISINFNLDDFKKGMSLILYDRILLFLYCGVFVLHALLVLNFIVLPIQLEILKFPISFHWKIYLLIITVSFLIVSILFFYCKKKYMLLITANFLLILSSILNIFYKNNFYMFLLGIQIFFIAFNILESFLPTLVSRRSPIQYKGMTMGIYSTIQFLSSAIGGILGGWILGMFNIEGVMLIGLLITMIWFLLFLLVRY
ncbi:MFS transporter [Buchnera aphidicola (Formosaphis micheliae)]|uniref:MFS transporter n=1 Tax=Buchnera aphidicola TaxID=9 RepID=UPI0031B89C38